MVKFLIDLSVCCHTEEFYDSDHVDLESSPSLSFSSAAAAADRLERLASDAPDDPIRLYADVVRRTGARVAAGVRREAAARLAARAAKENAV